MNSDRKGGEREFFCPVNAVLNLLSERWTLHIVHSLLGGTKRFNEIAREIGINPRTLRERLRLLEETEVVDRRVVTEMPPNVEYSLTAKGRALSGILQQIADWGRCWMKPPCDSADESSCANDDERSGGRS